MKLLIDAHLPPSLAIVFAGHEVVHTSQLEKGNLTDDYVINEISISGEYAVITKDTDFYYSFIAKRQPYKLVLVKLGNMRLHALISYFERNALQIIELLEKHFFIILEPETVRVLV